MIGGAVAAIPHPRLRTAAVVLIVGVAAWLELRDFAHHANTLTL